MTCDPCEIAEQRAGWWPEYRASCFGCRCRGIARAAAARDAFAGARADDLVDMVRRIFPTDQRDAAIAEIRRWWDIDHSTTGTP